jgi:hypothetical protein
MGTSHYQIAIGGFGAGSELDYANGLSCMIEIGGIPGADGQCRSDDSIPRTGIEPVCAALRRITPGRKKMKPCTGFPMQAFHYIVRNLDIE